MRKKKFFIRSNKLENKVVVEIFQIFIVVSWSQEKSWIGFYSNNNTTNQPAKKLTKGGVLRKSETLSLARLDHSCVRNA
jgi:hypothetical protein